MIFYLAFWEISRRIVERESSLFWNFVRKIETTHNKGLLIALIIKILINGIQVDVP